MRLDYFSRFLIIFFVCFIFQNSLAYDPQPGTPLANNEHPRLHITPATVSDFRSKIATHYFNEYQDYVNYYATQDVNSEDNDIDFVYSGRIFYPAMVHHAFIAALGTVPGINYPLTLDQFAQRAIDALTNGLNGGQDLGFPGVIVYDWTWNFMNPTDRQALAMMMKTRYLPNDHVSSNYSIDSPQLSSIDGLFSSPYFSSIYAYYAGLALWGDGYYDVEADLAVDTFFDQMLDFGFVDAQNFIAESTGGWSEWYSNYPLYRTGHFILLDGWRTATGEDYIAQLYGEIEGNLIKTHGNFIHYMVDPFKYQTTNARYYDYSFISAGGGGSEDATSFGLNNLYLYLFPKSLYEGGATTSAGLLRGFAERYEVSWFNYEKEYLYGFLGLLASVPSITPEQANLPKYSWMKNFGVFVARTGFDQQSDGVFMVLDSHFKPSGHSGVSFFPGFSLTKFGELVNKRKATHRDYGNLSDYPGGTPLNIVIFDGGHNTNRSSINQKNDLEQAYNGNGNYDWGGIEQVTVKEDRFYHVHVDRSRAFESGIHHTREFIWLPGQSPSTDSDFLVVYDRTSAPSEPEWVYHVPWKPSVYGYNSTVDLTTGSGTSDRIGTAFIGSNVIVKELNGLGGEKDNAHCQNDSTGGAGAHGVAFVKTVKPSDARVEVTRVAQFDTDVCDRQGDLTLKSHRWQVSVRATQTSSEHRFLNVFEAADANFKSTMQPSQHIEAGTIEGLFIEKQSSSHPNYLVLFNKEDNANQHEVNYSINGQGVVRHIITGMQPNTVHTITDLTIGNSFDVNTEPNVERWDYQGVTQNVPTGVLYFETTIQGTHDFKISFSGQTGFNKIGDEIPDSYSLGQNHPNPFNPTTTLTFSLPIQSDVKVDIFNNLGESIETIINKSLNPGNYVIEWNASTQPSGVYFYRFQAGDFNLTKKMLYVK